MSKSTDLSALGNRLKQYEAKAEAKLPDTEYIIVRLDGHGFSKYTKGLEKPFDLSFNNAMEHTTLMLVKEFNALCGYTQSDEITIILPQRPPTRGVSNQIYSGRVQKLTSLTAGYCSAIFNKVFKHPSSTKTPYFDSRVYSVPTIEEAYNSIVWRCRDAKKNSKNVFAQTYCKHSSLLNLNSQKQVEYCLATTGKNWEDLPDSLKYGQTIFKIKQWVDCDNINPLAKPAIRTKYLSEGIDHTTFCYNKLEKVFGVNTSPHPHLEVK